MTVGLTPSIDEVDVGRSARETAQALGISARTVKRNRARRKANPT